MFECDYLVVAFGVFSCSVCLVQLTILFVCSFGF